jgi:uncharacterized membrane protein
MSDDVMRRLARVLSIFGLGVAGYLTYVHYAGLTPVCGISRGCETVQTSQYATLVHVPVSLLGLISYAIVFASTVSRGERAMLAGFRVSVTAFAFSVYLIYRELFTIHAICSWCVASAIIFTLLAAVTTARVVGGRPAARANGHYCGGLSARSRRAPAASGVQETAGVRKRIAPSRPAPAAVDGR